MTPTRIEIVAIGKEAVYSVGAVIISKKGDVYIAHKMKHTDFHESRHASGELHWRSQKPKHFQKIRDGTPIADFRGLENLGTRGFGLDLLPKLFKEYEVKQCDGIFFFDMRDYSKASFNMTVWMLTKEGLRELSESMKEYTRGHTYVYSACHPMIAITVFDGKIGAKWRPKKRT